MYQDSSASSSGGFSGRQSQSRWPFIVGASALGGFALLRRTKTSAALAAAGLWALERATHRETPQTYEARATFAINCSAEQAYRLWRDFEGLSRFLVHIDSVRAIDQTFSEWTAVGPFGKRLGWISEIIEDRPNERIAWRSVPGSDVETRGEIEFRPRTAQRGINVSARIEYLPPAGATAHALAVVLGRHPEFTIREDLRRFKAMLEAGEVPTIVGQPHGPRGLHGHLYRTMLRERQNATPPQVNAPAAAERRIA